MDRPAGHRPTSAAARVFICYAHDSQQHKDSVRHLAELLQHNGIETHLDIWYEGERRDWQTWAIKHIKEADYVLVIASPKCRLVGDGESRPAKHRGLRSELNILRDLNQEQPDVWGRRILPVVLPGRSLAEIPIFLQPRNMDHYVVERFTNEGVHNLLRALLRKPQYVRPPLGQVPELPPHPPIHHPPASDPGLEGPQIVDRDDEQADLVRALTGEGPNVVVVNGPAGVGKSRLVEKVLAGLRRTAPPPRIYPHPLSPTGGFDVKTIIDDIEADATQVLPVRPGESMLARLELALEAHGNSLVLIVVDPAERLLEPSSGRVVGLDLNEAFEVVRCAPHSRVKIVLVTQRPLIPGHENDWVSNAKHVPVTGLQLPHFVTFVDKLSGTGSGLLGSRESIPDVRRHLEGNPRLTELVYALVWWAGDLRPDRLVEDLALIDKADLPRVLTTKLVGKLPDTQLRVVEALAAFGTFVTAGTVRALVGPGLSSDDIDNSLRILVERHVVRHANGWYAVPDPDVEQLLAHLSEERRLRLLLLAAGVLHDLRTDDDDVHNIADLRAHFEEVAVLLRAREYRLAFDAVRSIDRFLIRWNCSDRLLEQRLALRKKLEYQDEELSNHNAIGYAFAARGRYPEAAHAFQEALLLVDHSDDVTARQKLLINKANLSWEQYDTSRAADLYREAMCEELVDVEDRAAALDGLADCHRRWGDYDAARLLSTEALVAARRSRVDSPLAVTIALKLARWHCELKLLDDADQLLQAAEATVANRRNYAAYLPACLDGRADLYLARKDYDQARNISRQAAAAAYAQHDPVIVGQARATLCLAYLHDDDPKEAERAIAPLEPSRRTARSLIVLALLAVVARRQLKRGKAVTYFDRLRQESEMRLSYDRADFAARDMAGLAVCHRLLDNNDPLEPALAAFETDLNTPTRPPGLADRLIFLVRELQRCARRPDRLAPVIDLLSDSTRR